MAFLVDSNVIIDVFDKASAWRPWSLAALAQARLQDTIALNAIIYGEISARFDTVEELEVAIGPVGLIRLALPWEAAFLAGKAFLDYRRRGGARTSILPDFYIGAHAAVAGLTLLTRDATRYRSYFPRLSIIAPN